MLKLRCIFEVLSWYWGRFMIFLSEMSLNLAIFFGNRAGGVIGACDDKE